MRLLCQTDGSTVQRVLRISDPVSCAVLPRLSQCRPGECGLAAQAVDDGSLHSTVGDVAHMSQTAVMSPGRLPCRTDHPPRPPRPPVRSLPLPFRPCLSEYRIDSIQPGYMQCYVQKIATDTICEKNFIRHTVVNTKKYKFKCVRQNTSLRDPTPYERCGVAITKNRKSS